MYQIVYKGRLAKEGNETVTNCYQLKMRAADGKKIQCQSQRLSAARC